MIEDLGHTDLRFEGHENEIRRSCYSKSFKLALRLLPVEFRAPTENPLMEALTQSSLAPFPLFLRMPDSRSLLESRKCFIHNNKCQLDSFAAL